MTDHDDFDTETIPWGFESLTPDEWAAMQEQEIQPHLNDHSGYQVLQAYRRGVLDATRDKEE